MGAHGVAVLSGVAVRLFGLGIGFALQVLMARVMGAGEYGAFVYALSLASLAAMFLSGGVELVIVREMGARAAHGVLRLPRQFLRWLARQVSARSVVVLTVLVIVVLLAPASMPWKAAFEVTGFAFVLMASGAFFSALLQASGRAVLSQVLVSITPQFLLTLAFAWAMWSGVSMDSLNAAVVQVVIATLVALAGYWLCFVHFGFIVGNDGSANGSLWSAEARRLLIFVLLGYGVARLDMLILGACLTMKEVAIYNVAGRIAEIAGLFLAASNQYLAPRMAALHRQGDHDALQRRLTSSIRLVFAGTILMAGALLVLGPVAFSWFGQEFSGAYLPMIVLLGGQMVNVALGPVGDLLAMVGCSELMVRAHGIAAALNLACSLALIPGLGVVGAAMANACSMAAWNIIMHIWIKKELALDTSIFSSAGGR